MVEQSFEFDLTSTQKLLSRYLDREITVEQARGQGVGEFTGTLVGTQGRLTLVWDIDTAIPGLHQARVSDLYTLGRPASLPQNATKQIELFPTAAGVGCEKKLVYVGQGALYPFHGAPAAGLAACSPLEGAPRWPGPGPRAPRTNRSRRATPNAS